MEASVEKYRYYDKTHYNMGLVLPEPYRNYTGRRI